MRSDELAAEMLDAVNERDLRRVLQRLAVEAGRPVRRDTALALIELLTRTAKRTLPTLTLATSNDPRAAAATPVAQTAARVYGLETEGMSAEDRDFELARQFARFAEAAFAHAGTTYAPDPASAATDAVARAAREFAPGLISPRRSAGASP
jgi:hypothetical protein